MSFFDLPPSAITHAALDAFLQERLPESLNLDYKRELGDRVFETIAAMANTYGGIVLIGVDEDPQDPTRPQLPPLGVGRDERERLVNQSYTRFRPPFAPDVVPVPLPGGNEVLVVRVDPSRAERPIVLTRGDDHKIFVRLEARNAPADRYRMAALFAEPPGTQAATVGVGDWNLMNRGPYPLDDRERSALAVRVAIEAQLPPDRLGHAIIDTQSRHDLAEAMRQSALSGWLENEMQSGGRGESWTASDWIPLQAPHSNLSWNATLRWRARFHDGPEAWVGGQVSILLPAANATSGRLALLVDATFDPLPLLAQFDNEPASIPGRVRIGFSERLSVRSLCELLLAMLRTVMCRKLRSRGSSAFQPGRPLDRSPTCLRRSPFPAKERGLATSSTWVASSRNTSSPTSNSGERRSFRRATSPLQPISVARWSRSG